MAEMSRTETDGDPESVSSHMNLHPMPTALFAGRFDPVTNGQLDIARRAADLFDHLDEYCDKPRQRQPAADVFRLATSHSGGVDRTLRK